MSKKLLLIVTLLLAWFATDVAEARRRRPHRARKKFQSNKTFGLGLMLGTPSGLSGKYYLGADTAIDFGIGSYGRHFKGYGGLNIQADFLWHPVVLASPKEFELPLYFGLGVRLWEHGPNDEPNDDTHVGLRAPLGILFDLNNTPLDFFIEFALVYDVIVDRNHRGFDDFNATVGARYYF